MAVSDGAAEDAIIGDTMCTPADTLSPLILWRSITMSWLIIGFHCVKFSAFQGYREFHFLRVIQISLVPLSRMVLTIGIGLQ